MKRTINLYLLVIGIMLIAPNSWAVVTREQVFTRIEELRPIVGDVVADGLRAKAVAASEMDIEYSYEYLTECTISSSHASDPDNNGSLSVSDLMVPRYREVAENWREYGTETTTRGANHAIIQYGRDSLTHDADFMQAAFQFFASLQTYDSANDFPQPPARYSTNRRVNCSGDGPVMVNGAGVGDTDSTMTEADFNISPIDVNAFPNNGAGLRAAGTAHGINTSGMQSNDLYQLALQASNGNSYQALRILQLYGHDNMANELYEPNAAAAGGSHRDCRYAIMDLVKPGSPSWLYQNNAIGAGWNESTRRRGQQVAEQCFNSFRCMERRHGTGDTADTFWLLCNDNRPVYEGDYYHVLAGAFARCRGDIAQRRGSTWASQYETPILPTTGVPRIVSEAIDALTRTGYAGAVKAYKLARFYEEVSTSGLPLAMRGHLYAALALIATTDFSAQTIATTVLANQRASEMVGILDEYPEYHLMIAAIINRQHFEVNFRATQHEQGGQLGHQVCMGQGRYSPGELYSIDTSSGESTGVIDSGTPMQPINTSGDVESKAGAQPIDDI